MSYTIVWNANKTEGIVLSGEYTYTDAKYATTGKSILGGYSTIASELFETYGQYQKCTIQNNVEIKE